MTITPSYSASDLLLFTHALDQIPHEAGGLDEPTRAKMGLRITMAAASGILGVPELIAFGRAAP